MVTKKDDARVPEDDEIPVRPSPLRGPKPLMPSAGSEGMTAADPKPAIRKIPD